MTLGTAGLLMAAAKAERLLSFVSHTYQVENMLSRRSLAILVALAVFLLCKAAAEVHIETVDDKVPAAARLSLAQIEHELHVSSSATLNTSTTMVADNPQEMPRCGGAGCPQDCDCSAHRKLDFAHFRCPLPR